ncbi:unnamed protein product [Umbelopsis sp. WA50703]
MGYQSPVSSTTRQPESLPTQPKSRIDPNQIPSPVQVQEQDQQQFEGKEYGTCSKSSIPLSSTQVRVVDQVPEEYFCNLDMSGRRTDYDYRPELRNGIVEYIVPEDYWAKTPQPVHYLFAIDVSWNSSQSGMLTTFCKTLSDILYDESSTDRLPTGAKIGIMTFDSTIHFYNLKAGLEQAQLMVVPDIEDVFVPLNDGLFVDPEESRQVAYYGQSQKILSTFTDISNSVAVLGPVINSALIGMKECGGRLIVLQSVLPTKGAGNLRVREQGKRTVEEEKTLLTPQDSIYQKWGNELVNAGVSVDLWLFPLRAHMDITTIGLLASLTGGDVHYLPNFNHNNDGAKLAYDMKHSLMKQTGHNGVVRIRCSNGLTVHDQFGNFTMKNSTDIELAGIDEDKSIAFVIKHDDKLDPKLEASFQCAMLYTTATGERRVRVINLSLPVTDNIANVFRNAQMDVTVSLFMRQAVSLAGTKSTVQLRDELTDKCVKILAAYRKHCAYSSSPGQLILPDSFKLFPLYSVAMLKSLALKSSSNLDIDTRVYNMRYTKSLGILEQMTLLYPRMFPLCHLEADVGEINQTGVSKLPPTMRVSYERLRRDEAYLLENGQNLYIWLGRDLAPHYLQALFGVDDLQHIDPRQGLPHIDSPESIQVRKLIGAIQGQRAWYMPIRIVRQQLDMELDFANLLVEDKNNDQMSYVDYLCSVHRQIQTEITQEKQDNIVASASYWTQRF